MPEPDWVCPICQTVLGNMEHKEPSERVECPDCGWGREVPERP